MITLPKSGICKPSRIKYTFCGLQSAREGTSFSDVISTSLPHMGETFGKLEQEASAVKATIRENDEKRQIVSNDKIRFESTQLLIFLLQIHP